MVMMSRTIGTLCSLTTSAVSREAAIAGNAEFFAPLIATVPRSGCPPVIRNLSMNSEFAPACYRERLILSQRTPQVTLRFSQQPLRTAGIYILLQHHQCHSQIVSGIPQRVSRRGQLLATRFC